MSDPVVLLSTGDVVGPAGGVTDNSMVLFSGTSGKLIKGNNAVVTAAGLALLDDVNAAAQRTTLGLKTGAVTDKTTSATDPTVGSLTKVGDFGVGGMLDLRSTIFVTGKPQDLYSKGFVKGFADCGPAGLAIPGIAGYDYGVLEVNAQWSEPSGAGGIMRSFTHAAGVVYTQAMVNATTWGLWVKNGASTAWRLPTNAEIDLNTITEGGWFQGRLGATNANLPTQGYFYLQVMNHAQVPGNCTQVAYEYTSNTTAPRKFTRGNCSGTWTAWSEDWTTSNLVKTVSVTDGTVGRVTRVGDFGLGTALLGDGAQLPHIGNLDSSNMAVTMGFYRFDNATIGAPSGEYGVVQVMPVIQAGGFNYIVNVAYSYASGKAYIRNLFNGVWTPWKEIALTDSPAFIGTPTAPTASAGTSTTQLATTAFVTTADNLKANINSPTFTGVPSAPTASAGTNTTQLANTAFVKATVDAAPMLGVGQTWQYVTGSRAAGTTYTNTTGRPIMVMLTIGTDAVHNLYINGLLIANPKSAGGAEECVSFVVPSGNTYSISLMPNIWAELR